MKIDHLHSSAQFNSIFDVLLRVLPDPYLLDSALS